MRTLIAIPACATALVAVLSGCGLTGGGEGGDEGEGGDGEQNDSVESGSAPDTEEVIGEATFPYHDNKAEVTVEINGLTERGDLLQLDYTLIPGTPESDAESEPTLENSLGANQFGDHYLVDTANLRRHTVVEDDGGKMLEPAFHAEIPYDEPTTLTALFASAEDMESVDVYLYDLPPIMDVPVTKADEEGR